MQAPAQQGSSRRGRKPGHKLGPPTLHPTATKIRPNQFHLATGMSKATGYRLLKSDPTFPRLYKPTANVSFWDRSELEAWMKSRRISD